MVEFLLPEFSEDEPNRKWIEINSVNISHTINKSQNIMDKSTNPGIGFSLNF